ncbi:shugoshin-1-like isoform X1 [Phragmites australis]|uniref:shugoshin-1-like isoform X1 n=1 Tax=Phragmites australis TaxID=29695 RepID=UPI002D7809DC|nr:shugoshin-1-like isoform X1 [Phragmites australis]
MAVASRGTALGGPHPNPNDDGPRFRSLAGKGKPVPLADITSTRRPNPTRSISVANVVKVNFVALARTNQQPDLGQSCHFRPIAFFLCENCLVAQSSLAWPQENAKLHHLLSEKTKIIEVSRVEMHKLCLALKASHQQNLQLTQTNSQMLAELNLGKDRVSCPVSFVFEFLRLSVLSMDC